jgi:hypothetical protein
MDAPTVISLAISIAALILSAISLGYVIKWEARDEVRFEQEQEEMAQRKREGLSAIYEEGPKPTEGGYEYRYALVNASKVPIDNPRGWLVDEDGMEVSDRIYGIPAYLLPEERAEVRLVATSIERELTLHLSWLASGVEHPDKASGAPVPR